MPEIHREAKSVTQVARSRQTFFKRIAAPDRPFLRFLMHYVPGVRDLIPLDGQGVEVAGLTCPLSVFFSTGRSVDSSDCSCS